MFTMILDIPKNNKLRKEKPPLVKSPFRAQLLEAPAVSKNFKTPISVFWGPNRGIQSSNFCTEMGDRIMKKLHWACTARGAHKCEKYHSAFSFRQGLHFPFLEVQVTGFSPSLTIPLLFTALHSPWQWTWSTWLFISWCKLHVVPRQLKL